MEDYSLILAPVYQAGHDEDETADAQHSTVAGGSHRRLPLPHEVADVASVAKGEDNGISEALLIIRAMQLVRATLLLDHLQSLSRAKRESVLATAAPPPASIVQRRITQSEYDKRCLA